jgi:fructose/tagatose bisphosphate aldolase
MLTMPVHDVTLTDIDSALEFTSETQIDALAVNLGQMHLHGRYELGLDLDRLQELTKALSIPLVLHGASSVRKDALRAAISLGIRKINVSSLLKQIYFETLRDSCVEAATDYNPYVVVGSGLDGDVLTAARLALRDRVAELMHLFGSANKA